MKVNALIFGACFILALGGGYLLFNDSQNSTASDGEQATEAVDENDAADETDNNNEEGDAEDTNAGETVAEDNPLNKNNCLSCHAVESMDVEGGNQGPDLSNAVNEVENKRGKELDAFLQDPSSTVMSTVIEDDPLDDDERAEIIEYLEEAAEAAE